MNPDEFYSYLSSKSKKWLLERVIITEKWKEPILMEVKMNMKLVRVPRVNPISASDKMFDLVTIITPRVYLLWSYCDESAAAGAKQISFNNFRWDLPINNVWSRLEESFLSAGIGHSFAGWHW